MTSKKKNNENLISEESFKKVAVFFAVIFLFLFIFVCFEVYVPLNPVSHETVTYIAKKGMGDDEIAKELQNLGIIRSNYFFRFYVIVSLQHSALQAGKYNLSPRMSIHQIAKRMATGDVVKNKFTIFEGWNLTEIGEFLQSKNICTKEEFLVAASRDYSREFDFLKNKPKDIGLEGFLFPDTYEVADGDSADDIVLIMLKNFDKKLTPELKNQIAKQNKNIFDVVTMASLLEKEVRTMTDKKIVSGILWKRLSVGMPLQLDATVNYITRKNDPGVAIKDTRIDSPYNTYKYKGLPKGPISMPGMNSIIAALNPTKTEYWFYLTDGITHYARTGEEHAANKARYLD